MSGTKQSASATSEVGSAHTPILWISRPTTRPLKLPLDQEDGQLLFLAGAGEDGEEVSDRRGGDPGLLAVQHIAALDLHRPGGDAFQVGAGVGLGHAQRADLFALQRRLEQAFEDVGVAEHVQELGAPSATASRRRRPATSSRARSPPAPARIRSGRGRSRPHLPGSAGRRSPAPPTGSSAPSDRREPRRARRPAARSPRRKSARRRRGSRAARR